MKRLLGMVALALAIVVPCGAQLVFELSCPTGSIPLPQGKSLNPSTGKWRAFLCIDPVTGTVTFNDKVTGAVVGSGAMVWPPAGIPIAKTGPNAWDATGILVPDANAAHFLSGAKTWIAPPFPPTMTSTAGGLVPTPPNDATKFLNGAAGYTVPAFPPTMTATAGGLVPTPPNDATKFLNGAGSFSAPGGGGVSSPSGFWRGYTVDTYPGTGGATIVAVAVPGIQISNPSYTAPVIPTATEFGLERVYTSSSSDANTWASSNLNTGSVTVGYGWPMARFQHYVLYGGLSTIYHIRCWIGMGAPSSASAAVETVFATNTPVARYAAFRFNSGTDTNWMAITSNGTSSTSVDTGVTPDMTNHLFSIDYDGTSVKFSIDRSLVATVTATIPNSTVMLFGSLDNMGIGAQVGFSWAYNLVMLDSTGNSSQSYQEMKFY